MRQQQRDEMILQLKAVQGVFGSLAACFRKHNIDYCTAELRLAQGTIERMKEKLDGFGEQDQAP